MEFAQKSLAHRLSTTRHAHSQPQARPTMLTCSPALSPIMGRCLSSRNAQTATPGRHRTQLLVAPWLACKIAVTFLAYWLPTTASHPAPTANNQPAATLSLTNQLVTAHQSKQQPVHHVSLGSKRESVPQHQYAPHARQHAAGPSQANNQTASQHAHLLTCPVTHNGKAFVVTKCSDSDTGPPPQSLASDSLAHKIAASSAIADKTHHARQQLPPPSQTNHHTHAINWPSDAGKQWKQ